MKKTILITIIIALMAFITSCGEEEEPKNQSATITGFFDNNSSATVKGYLTDTEWAGISSKINTAIVNIDSGLSGPAKDAFRDMFSRGIIFIVEKSPIGYTNWKTANDGKTVYLNINVVNGSELQQKLYDALEKIYAYTEYLS